MPMKRQPLNNQKAFTLIEILVVMGILVVVLIGLVRLFFYCSSLAETAGNQTIALTEAQNKMEEIRAHSYSLITTDYASSGSPGNTFNVTAPVGKGVIYIDSSNADLLKITIVVCWKNTKDKRVFGEDVNLNGVLDAGEDLNGNSQIDSIVNIVTYVAYH